MNALAPTHLDEAAEAYRADVVAAISAEVEVLASFVLGSGLIGGYRPGKSDLDLVYVGTENEIIMIEGAAHELPEAEFVKSL